MRKFILFLILCVSPLLVLPQTGYRPGFIVKNNGDTLNGMVLYSVDGSFGKKCQFKRFDIAVEFTYRPGDISAYGFRFGRYFESRRKEFYECLVTGPVSIYIHPGKPGGTVYVESKSTGFFKLNKGNNRIDSENFSTFSETLQYILQQAGIQATFITGVGYSGPAIAARVRQLSSQSGQPSQAFRGTPPVSIAGDYSLTRSTPLLKLGIAAGYQFLKVDIPGSNLTLYFQDAVFNNTYRPVAGVYLNQRLSRKSSLASVDLSMLYLSDTYYGYAEYTYSSEIYRDDVLLEFSGLQTPLAFRLTFGKKEYHPYVKAGLYKTWLLSHSYTRTSEKQTGDDVYTEQYSEFDYKGDWGCIGGGGIDFQFGTSRRLSLEALFIYGSQKLMIDNNNMRNTEVKNAGFSLMMHVNL